MTKRNLTRFLVAGIIVAAIFLPPFAKYQELRYRNKRLEKKIKALQEETGRLKEEKRRLETDISYVEKTAREKMGVAKKGEIILKAQPSARTTR